MIVVCEPVCCGDEHVPFNSAVLDTVHRAFPGADIAFLAESHHVQAVRCAVPGDCEKDVTWTPVKVSDRYAGFWQTLPCDFALVRQIYGNLHGRGGHRVITTATKPSFLLASKCYLRATLSSVPTTVVLHSNANWLVGWRSRNPLRRMRDLTSLVKLFPSLPFEYVVLEEGIKQNLNSARPYLSGLTRVFEHPIPPGWVDNQPPLESPVRFAFIGDTQAEKGFDSFVALAHVVRQAAPSEAEFHVIGKRTKYCSESTQWSALDTEPASDHIPRARFSKMLEDAHYVVLPYCRPHYDYCASGALLDAIGYSKPIIATRMPLFENLFRQYGDIGYLAESSAELADVVLRVLKHADWARYSRQVDNLRGLRAARSPTVLAERCKDLFRVESVD